MTINDNRQAYFEHFDFAHGDASNGRIIATLEEFLNGYYLSGLSVSALEHLAIRSLANLAYFLIFVHA